MSDKITSKEEYLRIRLINIIKEKISTDEKSTRIGELLLAYPEYRDYLIQVANEETEKLHELIKARGVTKNSEGYFINKDGRILLIKR